MENISPDSNIVKTILFIPRRYEKYKYYVNTNFQEPRNIHRDEISKFVLPYLKHSNEFSKVLDWLQTHKTFFLDADQGIVLELTNDYEANKKAILEAMQKTKLSATLADKENQKEAINKRQPIPHESRFESMIESIYKKIPGLSNRKDR